MWFLIAFSQKISDVVQNIVEILLFFFLFLSLKLSFSPSNFLDVHPIICFLVPKPDLLDSVDLGKLIIVYVNMMSDSHEWLVNIENLIGSFRS